MEKSKTKLNVVKVVLDVEESLEVTERDDNALTHSRLKLLKSEFHFPPP